MSGDAVIGGWERLVGASSMVDVLAAQEDVDGEALIRDIAPLVGADAPEWLQHLVIPPGWTRIEPPAGQRDALARLLVAGPRPDGGWEAAETLRVVAYTGYAAFHDVADNAARTLRDFGASAISSRVLRIPPQRWVVAVRGEGVASLGARPVLMRQSNYLAGSEEPGAGRLIVHNLLVDTAALPRWSADMDRLSAAVQDGFVTSLGC